MRVLNTPRHGRSGFTLIEILVVILIIAVLVSLTAGAVLKFIGLGPSTVNRSEISQLESGIAAFNQAFGLDSKQGYFPSRLWLCENYYDYFVGQDPTKGFLSVLHQDSLNYLQRLFPKLWKNKNPSTGLFDPIDWNGNGAATDAAVLLEGDQCLVFFLGGIPQPGTPKGCQGFSFVASNPAASGGTRKGPFYEFNSSRLVDRSGAGYWSYLDAYGKKPYLYFSSYSKRNNYNRYYNTNDASGNPILTSDCATVDPTNYPTGVWPYAESTSNYVYPSKYQIISAGADSNFGPGTDLTATTPYYWNSSTAESIILSGQDDQANFSDTKLGVAP
jgi:prepilin-type N-terminal cleavage/methylation domain-containing protein